MLGLQECGRQAWVLKPSLRDGKAKAKRGEDMSYDPKPTECGVCHKMRMCIRNTRYGELCLPCQRSLKFKAPKSMAFRKKNYTLFKRRGY